MLRFSLHDWRPVAARRLVQRVRSGLSNRAASSILPYRRFFWVLGGAWTAAVAGSFCWNLAHNAEEVRILTVRTAEALLQKDVLYREWSILHGGVYIPVSAQPELSPEGAAEPREIVTSSGQRLTLLNPALVSRQVFALQDKELGVRAHLISLNPIQPANRPDEWERQGLEAFETGAREVSGMEDLGGSRYFRLMRPLVIVRSCLRCHEEQGHKPGEIRGGISVSVPMNRFSSMENIHLGAAHSGLWVMGLAGLVLGVRNLAQHSQRQHKAELEKEALLQEIHHRVKNNLQVISSLLQLQINEISDPATAEIFRESQLRIRSMALIHEKLYHSESLARIDLADYLRSLVSLLFSTYESSRGRISLELDLSPVFVSVDTAIPLGLIANELITNCLKFAFPTGRKGRVTVQLQALSGSAFRFRVADEGIGLPQGFAIDNSGSLGMRLVRILARQLRARCAWENLNPGTSFTLEFQEPAPNDNTSGYSARDSTPVPQPALSQT